MDELIVDWSLTTPSIANNLDEAKTAAFTTKNDKVLHFFSQFLENIYLVHLDWPGLTTLSCPGKRFHTFIILNVKHN